MPFEVPLPARPLQMVTLEFGDPTGDPATRYVEPVPTSSTRVATPRWTGNGVLCICRYCAVIKTGQVGQYQDGAR